MANNGIYVNTEQMGAAAQSFRGQSDRMEAIAKQIIACRNQLQLDVVSSAALKLQIGWLNDQVLDHAARMNSLADALERIVQLYTACEKDAAGKVGGIRVDGAGWAVAVKEEGAEEGTDKRSWWKKVWDWVWGNDLDTKYTHTTKEQEAAADAHMQHRIQKLMDSDRFSEEAWANATVEERKEILRQFMNECAKIMGVKVKSEFGPMNKAPSNGYITKGQYTHGNKTVTINMYIVENYSAARSYELMETIVHELRHGYQKSAIDNPTKYQVSQETINEWKNSFDNYKNTEGFQREYGMTPEEAYDAYRNQAVERDARWFAGQE